MQQYLHDPSTHFDVSEHPMQGKHIWMTSKQIAHERQGRTLSCSRQFSAALRDTGRGDDRVTLSPETGEGNSVRRSKPSRPHASRAPVNVDAE
jgi:hypothetical protein